MKSFEGCSRKIFLTQNTVQQRYMYVCTYMYLFEILILRDMVEIGSIIIHLLIRTIIIGNDAWLAVSFWKVA
jgi:hypothetical protein